MVDLVTYSDCDEREDQDVDHDSCAFVEQTFNEYDCDSNEYPLDQVLQLQQQVCAYELEVRNLRAQLESQRVLLQQLQEDALMSIKLRGGATLSKNEHPLLQAASTGDALMVAILLDNGADPRVQGNSAILLACQKGHHGVAEMLLERGSDVHVDHDSPLLWAVERGDVVLAKLLIKYGARCGTLENLAVRMAVRNGNHDMVKVLLQSCDQCQSRQ
jgi:ankyrin repeat protein